MPPLFQYYHLLSFKLLVHLILKILYFILIFILLSTDNTLIMLLIYIIYFAFIAYMCYVFLFIFWAVHFPSEKNQHFSIIYPQHETSHHMA